MKRSSLMLLGVALALAASSCADRGRGTSGGALRAVHVVGAVSVQAPGQSARPLRQGQSVATGASLRTGRDGRVRLETGGGQAVELAPDSQATIVSDSGVSLGVGSALAEAGSGSLSFDSLGIVFRVTGGIARLERLLGTLRVGVYSGTARADLLGSPLNIPAYRELFFSGGIPVDRSPRPLQLKQSDQWDRRILGDVLVLDRELAQFGRGFNSEFAARSLAPRFFMSFLGMPGVDAVVSVAPAGTTAADKLIGLVFADRLVKQGGAGKSVQALFTEMVAENRALATWGLIAKERGLALGPLFPAVLEAIRRGTAGPGSASPPGTSGGGGGGGQQQPRKPAGGPSPKPSPTSSSPPPTTPSPKPTSCSLLGNLLGRCNPSTQTSSSSESGSGGGGSQGCSILGVLLDPKC